LTGAIEISASTSTEQPEAAPASAEQPLAIHGLKSDWARFALLAAEFGLLTWIVRLFELEGAGFGNLLVLAWAGFIVHHLLPLRLRLPFFVALSIAGLALVAGPRPAVVVLGGGLLFIGVCHLPIHFALRVGLLSLLGGLLVVLRLGLVKSLDSAAWPLLGSLFMFRLIIYLYDLRFQTAPFSPSRACAYFFMLPNVCFPLFPVIDYKTFCTTHFNGDALRIYQSGLRWIMRGVIQLLLYRLVYQLGLVDSLKVDSVGGVARFMVTTYLLYFRVSGQFHLIIGLLHLFGFNLPETHHRYLLASSFTDFWRRINIYWKDFITKIFFYPAYFRMKGLGPVSALVLATLYAFFATWALHAYQWLWLRGTVAFTWQDILFWSVLGGLVVANSLYESKWGRRRALTRARPGVGAQVRLALATVGTFLVICTLWTVWSCESLDELRWLAAASRNAPPGEVALILGGLVGLGLAAVVGGQSTAERTDGLAGSATQRETFSPGRDALGLCLTCGALLVVAFLPRMHVLETGVAGDLLAAARKDQLNRMDVEGLRRGYYEDLNVPQRLAALTELKKAEPPDWASARKQLARRTEDASLEESVPSARAFFRGQWVTHNQWGMRDRERDKPKPPGTVRVALLGSSHEYGSGVADDEPYPLLLENRLNRESGGKTRYEVLNFARGNQTLYQSLLVLREKIPAFDPDSVCLVFNSYELGWSAEYLAKLIRSGYDIPFENLQSVADRAKVGPTMPEATIKAKLMPYMREMLKQVVEQFAALCRSRDIPFYAIFRPHPFTWSVQEANDQEKIRLLFLQYAEESSVSVLDLSHAFDRVKNRIELIVAPWDGHTNALGHHLLADALYRALQGPDGHCVLEPPAGRPQP
jgi:hypothetical protein